MVPRPPALDPYVLRGMKVRFTFPLANVIPEFMTPAFKTHNVGATCTRRRKLSGC